MLLLFVRTLTERSPEMDVLSHPNLSPLFSIQTQKSEKVGEMAREHGSDGWLKILHSGFNTEEIGFKIFFDDENYSDTSYL